MHTWPDIATTIGGLLTLATAAINLAAAVQTRPRRSQQDPYDGDRKPDGQ